MLATATSTAVPQPGQYPIEVAGRWGWGRCQGCYGVRYDVAGQFGELVAEGTSAVVLRLARGPGSKGQGHGEGGGMEKRGRAVVGSGRGLLLRSRQI